MTSHQGTELPGEKRGVDLDPILKYLGPRGRYQMMQLVLNGVATLVYALPVMDFVFIGYQPDYQCRHLENVTQVEDYLPDDVTNVTVHDVRYQKCSIDVTVNSSGTSSTHSLPCVAGVNFSMPDHTSFVTEWSLVCDQAGLAELTQTGLFAGQIAGRFLSSVLADRYGRKKVYVTSTLGSLLTLIAMALAPTYLVFLVCKIAVGFFVAGTVRASYALFIELLPQRSRHLASVSSSLVWASGCLVLAGTAYGMQGVSWRYLSLALSSVFLYSLLLPCLLDESPRWLLATGRIGEAETILKKACTMNRKDWGPLTAMLQKSKVTQTATATNSDQHTDSSTNFITLKDVELKNPEVFNETTNTDEKSNEDALQEESRETEKTVVDDVCSDGRMSGVDESGSPEDHDVGSRERESLTVQEEVFSAKYTVLDLFRHRIVFVPFLVTVAVWMTNNLYYFLVVLGSASLSGDRFLNFSLLTLMDIPASVVSLFLIPRFNRRPLAFAYGILTGSFLFVSVGLLQLGRAGSVLLTLATVSQYVGMFCLAGSYTLLFTYHMEVYPTSLRAVGSGIAGTITEMTNMAAPFFLLWARQTSWAPGVLVGCLVCLASFSIWLLPETRRRKLPDTLEEIRAWKRKALPVSS